METAKVQLVSISYSYFSTKNDRHHSKDLRQCFDFIRCMFDVISNFIYFFTRVEVVYFYFSILWSPLEGAHLSWSDL